MDWEEHERLWYALKGVDNAMQDGSLREQVDALSRALDVALNILPPYQPQPGDLYRALGLPVPDGAEPPLRGASTA